MRRLLQLKALSSRARAAAPLVVDFFAMPLAPERALALALPLAMALLLALAAPAPALAAGGKSSATPDALGAKALLEDLIVRRYSQELGTRVERSAFTLGAQLDLKQIPPKPNPPPASDSEPISDLMLGALDPEALLKKYAGDEKPILQGLLANYKIRGVALSVGLKNSVSAETKAAVEKWLKGRLAAEFGSIGKGTVETIATEEPKKPTPTPEPAKPVPKSALEMAEQFQGLLGQLALALAFLIGIILYALVGAKDKGGAAAPSAEGGAAGGGNLAIGGGGRGAGAGPGAGAGTGAPAAGDATAAKEGGADGPGLAAGGDATAASPVHRARAQELAQKLAALAPRVAPDMEKILRSWCQLGEDGYLRLSCFVDAVGTELGKLPIPVDAMSEVARAFAKMPEVSLKERNDVLQKVYWDLQSSLNLGPDVLSRPFGYLGAVNVDAIRSALIEENPRMRALVALHMPSDLRTGYMKSLPLEKKKELLLSALELREAPLAEIKAFDSAVRGRLAPSTSTETVSLGMTIEKIVASLSAIEAVTLLPQIDGPALVPFKRAVPLLAFLGQWPDDKLSVLLARAGTDEIMALIRVRPDLSERLLRLSPTLTVEMIQDELARPDRVSEQDKSQWLAAMSKRLSEMIALKEASLEDIFPSEPIPAGSGEPGGGDTGSLAA